ncbi:MAG TPA: LamG domain-containing protein, partial [Verrucomicrobiae bacterium]
PWFTGAADAYVSLPPLGVTSASMSFTAWIYPTVSQQNPDAGLIFNRVSSANGLCFADDGVSLNYGWNDDGALWHYSSGLVPPANQWSFVALVITPTNATFYLYNAATNRSNVNVHNHNAATFTGETRLADDHQQTRRFQGQMAQVAVFGYSLTRQQVGKIYTGAGGVVPSQPSDANFQLQSLLGGGYKLQWDQGQLLETTNLAGPWTTNPAVSPFTMPLTGAQKFYRIKLP